MQVMGVSKLSCTKKVFEWHYSEFLSQIKYFKYYKHRPYYDKCLFAIVLPWDVHSFLN